jgi:hypothetical protein
MVFTRHLRLALAGTALLLSFVGRAESASTFLFTECIDSCVITSGCRTNECMCREARGFLLDSVVACMFFNCKTDLRNFEDAFLDPVEQVCEDNNRKIPSSKIDKAESLANSYISKLPALTTAQTSAVATSTPKPTTALIPTSSAKQAESSATEESSSSETSAVDRGDELESTSATETITSPAQVAATPSATETSAAASESHTPQSGNSNTNPFASPSSAAWRTQASLSLLGLPLALVMFALRW